MAFFIPLFSFAQKMQVESFLGIKFGVCKEEALTVATLFGAHSSAFYPEREEIELKNFKLDQISSERASFCFINDRLYKGVIEFAINDTNFIKTFNALKYSLSEQYGYGKDFSWFDAPYYPGAGNELAGIIRRKAKICHAWGNSGDITSGNFVSIEVCSDKVLRIFFQNRVFSDIATAQISRLSSNQHP